MCGKINNLISNIQKKISIILLFVENFICALTLQAVELMYK